MLALLSCALSFLGHGPRSASVAMVRPRSASLAMVAAAPTTGCDSLLRSLFDGVVSPDEVAAACSASVEWDDLTLSAPAVGRDAVRALLVSKFPRGSKLVIDRLADGQRSGGFTWHREAVTENGPPSEAGLRGTLFAELDAEGQICYVREACEPILKPGQATEALLKAVTENADRPPKPPPTFTQRTPTGAASIARYLWEEAYPGGAEPTEALVRALAFALALALALGLALALALAVALDLPQPYPLALSPLLSLTRTLTLALARRCACSPTTSCTRTSTTRSPSWARRRWPPS